jgi:alcohol dehydrogenase (cytochrome c)
MSRSAGGFGLENIVNGLTLEGGIVNPRPSLAESQGGSDLYRKNCAVCHGGEGEGFNAPPVNRAGLLSGDSDFAIYKAIRDGITDTAMAPVKLSIAERWQVVAYLTMLRRNQARSTSDVVVRQFDVSEQQIRNAGARTDQWLTYSGTYDGHRFTSLDQITPTSVDKLRLRWVRQLSIDGDDPVESTALVLNGVIFTTPGASKVLALDAKSGETIWEYSRHLPPQLPLCCRKVNRGLAVLDGTLYLGTLDGSLVGLNASTGAVSWETQVVKPDEGYSLTGAPLVVQQSVIVGVAGGDYGARGFVAAFDAKNGALRWRFDTVPGPGAFGHDTWSNDAWKTGGGPTWNTGSYDPDLNLIYWGVGNPSPNFAGDVRPGDNLFTDSVIALQADTGRLAWHFQFTPHDEHDWDSAQTPILANLTVAGRMRQVICWANRNGFYYVLDRRTGEFLAGVPYVRQTWAEGLDAKGRPIPMNSSRLSAGGLLIRPAVWGGTNWQNPAYDDSRKLVFVPATEGASVYTKSSSPSHENHAPYLGSSGSNADPPTPFVRALDAATGLKKWEHESPPLVDGYGYSGLLSTGGGVVFGAAGGTAFALDSSTGTERWRLPLGGDTMSAPVSFMLDGEQVVIYAAGHAIFLFGL